MSIVSLNKLSAYFYNAYGTEILNFVPYVDNAQIAWFKLVPPDTENSIKFTLVEFIENNDKVLAEIEKLESVPDNFIHLVNKQDGYGIKAVIDYCAGEDAEYILAMNALVSLFNLSVQSNEDNTDLYINEENSKLMHTYLHYKGDCSLLESEIKNTHAFANENGQSSEVSVQAQQAHTRKTNAEASVLMLDAYPQLKQTHTFDVDTGLLVEHTK